MQHREISMTVDEIIQTHGERLREQNGELLLKAYKYQPQLTARLDGLVAEEFTNQTIYEVVLWKLGRFPEFTEDLLRQVNDLKGISVLNGKYRQQVSSTLRSLLSTKGIQLPMASTILRFRNPGVFQIIDERAYRIVCDGEPDYPSKPAYKVSNGYLQTCIDIYFSYLAKLKKLADKLQLDFSKLDRILYQLDIELGNRLSGSR
jgi:hypothetical protein